MVTVGGTNGKGSVVAYLEAMMIEAGLRSFAYTSPHLIDFSERFRIDGRPADDAAIVEALDAVEEARGDVFLSYFEHVTLTGFVLAARKAVDVWVLEVGLGGRLDAVNVLDPDVAVITSIALDHTDWLGPTRLHIGREKAGIARPGRPLILGERRPPKGLDDVLEATGATLWRAGHEYSWRRHGAGFRLYWKDQRMDLPIPAMAGRWQLGNAATACLAAMLLRDRLAIPDAAIEAGVRIARVSGRLQRLGASPEVLVDVAHNPAAARALASELGVSGPRPTIAVFSALAGKDAVGIGRALSGCFDRWLVPPLEGDRVRDARALAADLERAPVAGRVDTVESMAEAVEQAIELAGPKGRVVVFGSFRTVAEAWPLLQSH